MNIEAGRKNIDTIISYINNNKLVIPNYQRKFCWDKNKIDLLVDSVMNGIVIGLFQFRLVGDTMEVVDGCHRLRVLINVLYGKGFYFDFENCTFTQDSKHFDYSVMMSDIRRPSKLPKNISEQDFNKLIDAHNKFYFLELLCFTYVGTDNEIEMAFNRINSEGVAFTPKFEKVDKKQLFEL